MSTQSTDALSDAWGGARRALKRRGIIAAAGAALAGILATQRIQPVGATHQPEDVGLGLDNTVTNNSPTRIIAQSGFSSGGTTVFTADASASAGSVTGLFGKASGNAAAVVGFASGATATDTLTRAVGVYGVGGSLFGTGVLGRSPAGQAVVGVSGGSAVDLSTDLGVPTGMSGYAPAGGFGLEGSSSSTSGPAGGGAGVRGYGNQSTGVFGTTDALAFPVAGPISVQGRSNNGTGVYGETRASFQYGVLGTTYAPNSTAIAGTCTGDGSSAFSGGTGNANAFAGVFQGNVVIQGRLVVSDPSYKSGVLKHPDGSNRLVYCVESPESWIEDFGEANLVNGRADVPLDRDFAAIVQTDHYHVFPISHDATSKGLAITARHADRFEVTEHSGGGSSGTFSYRIVAKPKTDKKAERLAKFTMPNIPLPDVAKLPRSSGKP